MTVEEEDGGGDIIDLCGAGSAASTIVGISMATTVTLSSTTALASFGSSLLAAGAKTLGATNQNGASTLTSGAAILMGAQRFVASAGLSANVSAEYRIAIGALDWSSGNVGAQQMTCGSSQVQAGFPPPPPLGSGSGTTNGTVANTNTTMPTVHTDVITWLTGGSACEALSTLLIVLAIMVTAVLLMHAVVHLLWAHRVNRAWYKNQGSAVPGHFIRYPPTFVFPSLLLVLVSILLTGLITNAVQILAGDTCVGDDWHFTVLAWIALVVVLAYLMLAARLLVHFNRTARKVTWHVEVPAHRTSMVRDPLFRAISIFRKRFCCRAPRSDTAPDASVLERKRGAFDGVEAEIKEPARTERLLARPCVILRSTASDSLDSCHLGLMSRSAGSSARATFFELGILFAQLTIGALNGLGPGLRLQPGSASAVAQLVSIAVVQITTAFCILCKSASNDRLVTLTTFVQFLLEAGQTFCLLLHTFSPDPGLVQASFALALSAVCTPVIPQLYDSILVQLVRCMRRDMSPKEALGHFLMLLMLCPSIVLRLLGVNVTVRADELASHAAQDAVIVSCGVKHSTLSRAQIGDVSAKSEAAELPEKDDMLCDHKVLWPTLVKGERSIVQYPAEIIGDRRRISRTKLPAGLPPKDTDTESPRPGYNWLLRETSFPRSGYMP